MRCRLKEYVPDPVADEEYEMSTTRPRLSLGDSLDVLVDPERAIEFVSRTRTAEELLRKIQRVLESHPMTEEQSAVYNEICEHLGEPRYEMRDGPEPNKSGLTDYEEREEAEYAQAQARSKR